MLRVDVQVVLNLNATVVPFVVPKRTNSYSCLLITLKIESVEPTDFVAKTISGDLHCVKWLGLQIKFV